MNPKNSASEEETAADVSHPRMTCDGLFIQSDGLYEVFLSLGGKNVCPSISKGCF